MKELLDKYALHLKLLFIPYLIMLFLLAFPMNFLIYSPGGLTEVDRLIEVDDEYMSTEAGTISTTYVMSLPRPTAFEMLLAEFNKYCDTYALPTSYENYTNQEINAISYYDKDISVSTSIIVAYEEMAKTDPSVVIAYESKVIVFGKASYLSHYDDIEFGDEFVQMEAEGGLIITPATENSSTEIANNTISGNTYDFTFIDSKGDTYVVGLTKDADTNLFGITFATYNQVNADESTPTFAIKASTIGGSSGGLLQTLAVYNMLSEEDITHGLKVAGTGTMDINGNVGNIGAVKQKVLTAYLNHVDVFFMSPDDYLTAVNVCVDYGIDYSDWLVSVATFSDALTYLEGLGE